MPLPRDFQSSKHSRNFVLLTMNVAFMKYVESTSTRFGACNEVFYSVFDLSLCSIIFTLTCLPSFPLFLPSKFTSPFLYILFYPTFTKREKVVFISIKEAPSLCSDFTVRKPLSCEKNSYSLVSAVSKEIRRCAGASARELLDELMRGIHTEFRKDNG